MRRYNNWLRYCLLLLISLICIDAQSKYYQKKVNISDFTSKKDYTLQSEGQLSVISFTEDVRVTYKLKRFLYVAKDRVISDVENYDVYDMRSVKEIIKKKTKDLDKIMEFQGRIVLNAIGEKSIYKDFSNEIDFGDLTYIQFMWRSKDEKKVVYIKVSNTLGEEENRAAFIEIMYTGAELYENYDE